MGLSEFLPLHQVEFSFSQTLEIISSKLSSVGCPEETFSELSGSCFPAEIIIKNLLSRRRSTWRWKSTRFAFLALDVKISWFFLESAFTLVLNYGVNHAESQSFIRVGVSEPLLDVTPGSVNEHALEDLRIE